MQLRGRKFMSPFDWLSAEPEFCTAGPCPLLWQQLLHFAHGLGPEQDGRAGFSLMIPFSPFWFLTLGCVKG